MERCFFKSAGGEIEYDGMSTEEKELFRRAVASGELSKMIEPWDPWLKPPARTLTLSRELVKPLSTHDNPESSKDDSESDSANEIPAGPETPLLTVSNLTTAEPSPLIAFHLIDILYSYCFTLRLHNGSAIICGLCDLQRLIQTAAKCLRSEKSRKAKRDELKSLLKHAERKVCFIMCWVREQEVEVWSSLAGVEIWSSLAGVVKVEKASILEYQAKGRFFDTGRKTMKEGKTLIEEVA
ncbi:hypothetical protein Droror1_Dr00009620 [Drosera rotundifolia]